MARKSPTADVLRALFARSGNRCAFPGCTSILVNEKNQFIAQVCHIEAANVGGERWNENQTDEERRSYENLVILCYPHHVETNDVLNYSVETLRNFKNLHESEFHKNIYKIDEALLYKLEFEMQEYWAKIELLNSLEHVCPDLALPINAKGTYFEIHRSANEFLVKLSEFHNHFAASDNKLMEDLLRFLKALGYETGEIEKVPYYQNPFINRNWEFHCIGITNYMNMLKTSLFQLEIKYLEEYLKTNSNDIESKQKLDRLKNEFNVIAKTAGLAD